MSVFDLMGSIGTMGDIGKTVSDGLTETKRIAEESLAIQRGILLQMQHNGLLLQELLSCLNSRMPEPSSTHRISTTEEVSEALGLLHSRA